MSIAEEEREGQGSNEPTREQCLLDETGCLYTGSRESLSSLEFYSLSFMLEGDRTGRSISEFKNYLPVNHGLHDVAKKFCIQKVTVEISIRRCKKEPQFPNGKVLACNKH